MDTPLKLLKKQYGAEALTPDADDDVLLRLEHRIHVLEGVARPSGQCSAMTLDSADGVNLHTGKTGHHHHLSTGASLFSPQDGPCLSADEWLNLKCKRICA